MAEFNVNQYSSAEEEEAEIQENQTEKKKRIHLRWTKSATFQSEEEAVKRLGINIKWSIEYSNETEEGKKVFYRCTQVKKWKAPNSVKPGALDQKRKRGRPKNMTTALLLE